MRRHILFTVAFLLYAVSSNAQDNLQSDMGDQNAQLLNKNETQVEVAAIANRFDDKSGSALNGSVFLRYGIAKKLELRAFVQDGYDRDKFMQRTIQSFNPLSVGAKVSVLKDNDHLPDVALAAYMNIPATEHTSEQSIHWSPALFLILEKELNNKQWDLLANTGFQQNSFSKDVVWQAVGRVKYQGLKKMDLTLELTENYQPHEEPAHCLDMGWAYDINKDVELNASAGGTIFTHDANQFVCIGLSVRMR
jgi:hypothetical protein